MKKLFVLFVFVIATCAISSCTKGDDDVQTHIELQQEHERLDAVSTRPESDPSDNGNG